MSEASMQKSEEKVKEIMAKLLKAQEVGSYEFISEELIKKRLCWYEENKNKIRLEGSDVKKAYTLLIIEYLGLNPKEATSFMKMQRKLCGDLTTSVQCWKHARD